MLTLISHRLNYYTFKVLIYPNNVNSPNLCSSRLFWLFKSFAFCTIFRINMSIYIFKNLLGFDWNCTKSIDQVAENRYFSNINSSNPWAWYNSPFVYVLISLNYVLYFYPRYFALLLYLFLSIWCFWYHCNIFTFFYSPVFSC